MIDVAAFLSQRLSAPLWLAAVVIVIGYLLGDISPAILIGRLKGVDIRSQGSGNAGTTNVLRVLGKKAAAATLLIDVLKGVAAVLIGRFAGSETLAIICGLAAFCGHIWPIFFHFRGGKGIATGFGVLLAFSPTMGLICLAAAAVGMLVSKRVSVGSLLAAAALLPLAWIYDSKDFFWFCLMVVIVYIKHRTNIVRLLRREEPKVNFKKSGTGQ